MDINFGDILFVRNKDTIVSKIIKWVTKSNIIHCAIFINNLHIVEISWNYKLKIRHLHYNNNEFIIKRYINKLTEEQKILMHQFIINKLNTKYDIVQTFGYLFKKLFRFKVINNRELYNCSEFCDMFYKRAGIDLLENDFEGTVTPGELFKSEKLVIIE